MTIEKSNDPDLHGLTDDDLEGLSEAEREALLADDGGTEVNNQANDDDDDGADDENQNLDAAAGAAAAGGAAADDAGNGKAKTNEQEQEQDLQEHEQPVPATTPKTLAPDDIKDQRAQLRKERAEAQRKVFDGLMEPEEFETIENNIQDKLDALVRAEAVDQTRGQIALERMTDDYNSELAQYQKAAKAAGLDISQGDLKKEFERMVALCAQDAVERGLTDAPGNIAASKAGLKDAMVLLQARHGKTVTLPSGKPAAPAQKPRPKVDDRSKIPPSLANVPAAAEANVGDDEFAHLEGMEIADQERAVARMTPEQQERWANQ
ncbi:hypothetical protein [Comamonas sp. JUb58]|uniref:hypothetical protein n=1 Tax=Comamonas sp. JUb58 TaxID=2485114 RepID=UPI00105E5572|nr:hypothetical protein [Comamonas sp. JUb58]TDS74405.1 hypothetical protein EDF71_11785 [Comamonas sp. JUb58]